MVLWRLRYKLALRDLPEMFAVRGIVFSYEAVRDWEAKLTPALAEDLRRRRRGQVGRSWYVDETYIKVHGRWCYLYRAIDRSGALVDVMFSEHRDMAAAEPAITLGGALRPLGHRLRPAFQAPHRRPPLRERRPYTQWSLRRPGAGMRARTEPQGRALLTCLGSGSERFRIAKTTGRGVLGNTPRHAGHARPRGLARDRSA